MRHAIARGVGRISEFVIKSGTGSWVETTCGRTLLDFTCGIGVVNTGDGLGTFNGALDDVMIFDRPISPEEVADAMSGYSDPTASGPNPASGSDDVPRDVILGWRPGRTAHPSG